jgi:hypothetical protein
MRIRLPRTQSRGLSRAKSSGSRAVLTVAIVIAAVVFSVVQDRVTAAGARQYVDLQLAAAEGRHAPVTVDEIMRPAVRRSVAQGLAWSAVVMMVGTIAAFAVRETRGGA